MRKTSFKLKQCNKELGRRPEEKYKNWNNHNLTFLSLYVTVSFIGFFL